MSGCLSVAVTGSGALWLYVAGGSLSAVALLGSVVPIWRRLRSGQNCQQLPLWPLAVYLAAVGCGLASNAMTNPPDSVTTWTLAASAVVLVALFGFDRLRIWAVAKSRTQGDSLQGGGTP